MKILNNKKLFNSLDESVSLKKGQIVKGIIVNIKDNSVIFKVKGKEFNAKGNLNLKKGDTVFAKVIEKTDTKLHFKIINSESSNNTSKKINLLKDIGLKLTKENTDIMKKLINNNIPISRENFENIFNIADVLERSGIKKENLVDISFFLFNSKLKYIDKNIIDSLKILLSSKKDPTIEQFIKKFSISLLDKDIAQKIKEFPLKLGLNNEKLILNNELQEVFKTLKYKLSQSIKENPDNTLILKDILSQQLANTTSDTYYSEIPIEYNGEKNIVKLKIKNNNKKNRSDQKNFSISILLNMSKLGNIGINYSKKENNYSQCIFFVETEKIKNIIENKLNKLSEYLKNENIFLDNINIKIVKTQKNPLFFEDIEENNNNIRSIDIKI